MRTLKTSMNSTIVFLYCIVEDSVLLRLSVGFLCMRILLSTAKAAATAYTHINVAIVTRSHFGNAKPNFHMNCWPSISINDRSCQQRCITGPANILTCTYLFIFTIYKSTGKQQRNTHPYSYLYAQWNIKQNYISNWISSSARAQWRRQWTHALIKM